MLNDDERVFCLLNVENCLALPYKTRVRSVVSRVDVIHAWTIPSLAVKVDAIPGRLNQLSLIFNPIGLYKGQYSEICGGSHRFMPILISVIQQIEFLNN